MKKTHLTILALTSTLSSCHSDELLRIKNTLTINDFNTQNAGHAQNKYTNPTTYMPSREYRAMMLTSSTLRLKYPTYDAACLDSRPAVESNNYASGVLSSPSRVTTAYHVAHQAIQGQYSGFFDSNDVNQSGFLKFSEHSRANENPLLAKRLFAIGLDSWANFLKNNDDDDKNFDDPRPLLRQWDFEWDDRSNQNFVTLNSQTSTFEGRDIAILKAKPHILLNNKDISHAIIGDGSTNKFYLPSGKFEFKNPGPFFSQFEVSEFKEGNEDVCELIDHEDRTIYSFHNQLYPQNELEYRISLYSQGHLDLNGEYSNCGSISSECDDQNGIGTLIDIQYKNCVRTTLDAIKQSSGGGFADNTCLYMGDGIYGDVLEQSLTLKGVLNAITPTGGPISSWGNNPVQITPESGQTNLTDYTTASLLGFQGARWARRETSYATTNPDPFNPIPNQPVSDGCPGDGSRPNCTVILSPSNSNGYPTPSAWPAQFNYELGQGGESPFDDIEQSIQAADERFRLLACQDNRQPKTRNIQIKETGQTLWNFPFGMAQGFTGSSNKLLTDPNDTTTRVDVFAPVCVPWSSSTWLDNWSWAKVLSSPTASGFAAASYLAGYFEQGNVSYLWEYLGKMYERRRINASTQLEVVHPPSFKTCPPNYYLNGVAYWKTPAPSNELVGIKELICEVHRQPWEQAPSDAKPPLVLRVPLGASPEHDGFIFDTPDKPKTFDLSATIGLVKAPQGKSWTELVEDKCPERQTVVAAVLRRPTLATPNAPLDFFHLFCARAPQGGKP